jgi:hypothetical protein
MQCHLVWGYVTGDANQALFDTDSCLRRAKRAQITAVSCYYWLCLDDVRLSRHSGHNILLLGSNILAQSAIAKVSQSP